MELDAAYMRLALQEAKKAYALKEVPVGAVLVSEGEVLSRAHNLKETLGDPTAHAELLTLQRAAHLRRSWRLANAVLYVTVEPCAMCAGALVQARVSRLVYGAPDPKAGAAGSVLNLVQFPGFNHRVEVTGGVLEADCRELVQKFFTELRGHPERWPSSVKGARLEIE